MGRDMIGIDNLESMFFKLKFNIFFIFIEHIDFSCSEFIRQIAGR